MSIHQQLSLSQLTATIEATLNEAFAGPVWVAAEVSELNVNRTGHCYLELVEKDPQGATLKAKVRAMIWARDLRMLKPYFETATKRKLTSGIKILALCHVNYHPVYGLSLNIFDIDPTFTLGDIEMQRQETIKRLQDEGVLEMNQELEIPIPPKRIAVVSSSTAAGFQDFVHQVESNPYGYHLIYKVFNAYVQGDSADQSIAEALDQVHLSNEQWDLVVIIRGGGSQTDLACFDSYTLANHIAQFPIPVITGIGHERDTTIADMVAHTRLKTPTAAAEFILEQFEMADSILHESTQTFAASVDKYIQHHKQNHRTIFNQVSPIVLKRCNTEQLAIQRSEIAINDSTQRILSEHKEAIHTSIRTIKAGLRVNVRQHNQQLKISTQYFRSSLTYRNERELHRVALLERTAENLDPVNILKRGYSITLHKGIVIKSDDVVAPGETIETRLHKGKIISRREE